jgi:hypothetical protein
MGEMTAEQIDGQYRDLCAELGQLALQDMELSEQLAKVRSRVSALRQESYRLKVAYKEAVEKAAQNVGSVVSDSAD